MATQNPLETLILNVLNENGFDKLDEESKKAYLPQYVAQAEQRLGAALLPLLNEEAAKKFVELTNQETAPETWWNFWQTNVVDFEAVVKRVLSDFALEIKESFAV